MSLATFPETFNPYSYVSRTAIPPESLKPVAEMIAPWWVCTTNKSYDAARKMISAGFDYYLPLEITRIKNPGEKARKKTSPLFPGWIFLNGEASRSLAYDLYLRPKTLSDKYQATFHAELLEVERKLAEEKAAFDKPKPTSLRIGDRVAITGGLFGTADGLITTVAAIHAARGRIEVILGNASYEVDIPDVERR